jgi:hypothetical protein
MENDLEVKTLSATIVFVRLDFFFVRSFVVTNDID